MKSKTVTWSLKIVNTITNKVRNQKFKGNKQQLLEKIDKIRNRNANVSVIATDSKYKRGLSDGQIITVSSKTEEDEFERMKNEPLTVEALLDSHIRDDGDDDFDRLVDDDFESDERDPFMYWRNEDN